MILNNCLITLQILPEKEYNGTYDESKIIEKQIYGEIIFKRKYNPNNPASQEVIPKLGINYNEDIDLDNTRIIYNNRYFEILPTETPSTVICTDWKVLELKEIFEIEELPV